MGPNIPHSYFSFSESDLGGAQEKVSGTLSVKPTAPRRAGEESKATPPRHARMTSGVARREVDEAFRAKHQLTTWGDFDPACRFPLLFLVFFFGELFPIGGPIRFQCGQYTWLDRESRFPSRGAFGPHVRAIIRGWGDDRVEA